MDELIAIFVDNHFSEEFKQEIERSFGLIDFFEYKDAYSGFVDILTEESVQSREDMKDRFVKELHNKLNFMLQEHTIVSTPEATVFEKNEILLALAHIQKLEDYTGVIRVLESLEPDEIKFATIISDLSTLDESTVLSVVSTFNPRVLDILKQYIYNKEDVVDSSEMVDSKLLNHFKLFTSIYGEDNLGSIMLTNGMRAGQRFDTYLTYVESDIVSDNDDKTALNILSCIYLSYDGLNSPLLVYRKYSTRLLHDLNRISRIEVKILSMIAKLSEYKKAEDEKARVSTQSA